MTASVTLDPMTPTGIPLYPAFTYPNGSLLEEPLYPLTVVDFIGCQTNLLFPYVTNYQAELAVARWATGILESWFRTPVLIRILQTSVALSRQQAPAPSPCMRPPADH